MTDEGKIEIGNPPFERGEKVTIEVKKSKRTSALEDIAEVTNIQWVEKSKCWGIVVRSEKLGMIRVRYPSNDTSDLKDHSYKKIRKIEE